MLVTLEVVHRLGTVLDFSIIRYVSIDQTMYLHKAHRALQQQHYIINKSKPHPTMHYFT